MTIRDGNQESGEVQAARQRPAAGHELMILPVRGAGQDLSGGHQGVDITVTLTQPGAGAQLAGTAVQQALGRDYQRLECRILALDGPILVTTSKELAEQAYQAGQGASTIIGGAFSWLPEGLDRVRRNCDQVWLALPGAAAATTHVSIIVSRRLDIEPKPGP